VRPAACVGIAIAVPENLRRAAHLVRSYSPANLRVPVDRNRLDGTVVANDLERVETVGFVAGNIPHHNLLEGRVGVLRHPEGDEIASFAQPTATRNIRPACVQYRGGGAAIPQLAERREGAGPGLIAIAHMALHGVELFLGLNDAGMKKTGSRITNFVDG